MTDQNAMANWNDATGGTITEEITGEIARVARTLIEMGACEDCAIEAATDVVLTMLAVEAPTVLAAFRNEIARQSALASPN
ncbi:hypothetical protein [Actinomadura nitritigenes]|uniref:hypothetical protein n=1 Tax=Actinomadura nitritigenes TaxID=134602 RepID=UPI003D8BA45E